MIRARGGNTIVPAIVVAFVIAVVTSIIAIFSVALASDIWNKFVEAFALLVGGGIAVTIVFSITLGGRRR
jgi:hypothetical protein